jgi:histone H3/H4
MVEMKWLIKKSLVTDSVHENDCAKGSEEKKCLISSDGLETLNGVVEQMLDDAAKRARSNNRVTIKPFDFGVLPKINK